MESRRVESSGEEEEEEEEGDGESGSESGSGSSEGDEEDEDDEESEEEDEPVLKYRRFAKEAVPSINEGRPDLPVHICCIAVHPRVSLGTQCFDWRWCALIGILLPFCLA